MKTVIVISIVSLLLGLGIGWFLGQRHGEQKQGDEMAQTVDGVMKLLDFEGASAVQAIRAIGTGENRRAVELLAEPVARFYMFNRGQRFGRLKELMAQIDELANTYPAVSNSLNKAKLTVRRRIE